MAEVRALAKYNEESGEVELCAVGSAKKNDASIKANACSTVELDLDSIINVASELKRAVESVLAEVEKAIEKLSEAGIEYEPKLIEALAAKLTEDLEYTVSVRIEQSK
jgi:hypothetical protein